MYGYRDHIIRTAYSHSTFYCPYSMYRLQCPFNYGYRPKVEEYPIQQQAPPKNPPPNYTPKLSDAASPTLTTVEFGVVAPCIFKFTYLWLKSGDSFWSYIVYVSKTSIAGWKYKAGQWVYFGLDLKEIKNFICS
jgi:hypothetical protein